MNTNDIENKYLNRLAQVDFPDMDINQQATEMAGGMEPEGAEPMTLKQFATTAADVPAGLVKGAIQGTIGLPGDIESIVYGVRELMNRGADEGRLDAFLRGLEQNTVLPTTENVKQWIDTNIGPLVPAGVTDERRREAAKTAEFVGELGGAGQMVVESAKAGARGAKAVGGAVTETLQTAPRGSINLSAFNPQKEIKTAVDAVSANPETAIYVPQVQRAPSVALSVTKPQIIGTGSKGIITVGDAGKVLEQTQIAFNKGKILDPTKPSDLSKMIDSASAEAEFQLSQPISGATWYDDDVATAFRLSSKVVPDLANNEPLRVLTTAFAASTSYNKRAGENWGVATRIADHLVRTGTVAARNPDNGKLWGGTTGPIMEQQLKLHEFMINKMGLDGYAEWLLTPHPVKEIVEMRRESGLYKTPSIPGKAGDMKMGAFIIGEKGGAFFLNLNGIKETTADKWFTRTYNRHTGTLTSGPVSEQGLVDAPRNESERAIMKEWNRSIAQNVKLDEQANQAVLWYFEQNLYYNLGVKSAKSESFSDGAKNLLNARGIAIDEPAAGAAGGSNARQARAKQAGKGAAGNPVAVGSPASNETSTVTGGPAPEMGAE
jgi:hypothetical protein